MTTKWATTLEPLPVELPIFKEGSRFTYLKTANGEINSVEPDTLFDTEECALTYMIMSCDTLISYQEKKRNKLLARLKELG